MKEVVLQTKNLTKRYGNKLAVDHVSMTIQKGDIYGLIGRNGAGKTTLTRMITALSFSDEGELSLFGKSEPTELSHMRKRIGCVVEMPAFYPNLTASENLEYYRILKGIPDKKMVMKTLAMVNLSDTGRKKFKNFSLGMKQRLGLALALLNNPDFIILDEPTNGLDPMGIVELRETLKNLNQELGMTILISSHILAELSLIATRYGIINEGKLIQELTQEELKEQCQKGLSITVDDAASAVAIIETVLETQKYKVISNKEVRVYDYLDNPSEVTLQLSQGGVRVSKIHEVGDNLEDYFMTLVGEA